MTSEDKRSIDYPYSPFVKQRETLDNGFSKGWGFQFHPNEKYFFDVHNHIGDVTTHAEVYKLLGEWFARLDGFRLGRVLLIASKKCSAETFKVFRDVAAQDERFGWLVQLATDNPDSELFKKALDCNTVGLKLHNASIMKGFEKPDIWLNEEWGSVFSLAQENNTPILWHVTQRMSESPYHGGGVNSYWAEGWKKGVTFTNDDLVDIFCKVLEKYPNLKVVGAHQLYMGIDKLSALLDNYKNLYFDTSVGFFLRWADTLYDWDRDVIKEFVIKYQDRILFGSDSNLVPGGIDEYLAQGFLCHARFIHDLRLPYDVLEKVAHINTEKVFGYSPIGAARRGNTRP